MLLYANHKDSVVYALAFSPDGTTLVSAARNGSVILRGPYGERHPFIEPDLPNQPINAITFTPDGSAVIVGGPFGWLGKRQNNGNWSVFGPPNAAPVTALAMLDDRTMAVGTGDRAKPTLGKFELWDVATGQKREPYFLEPNGVRAVAVCPEKKMVAWLTGYNKVRVWDIRKDKPIDIPQPKNCPAVSLSPDGTQVAAGVDYSVRVFAMKDPRRPRLELKGHKGQVSAVAFSPDGSTIATGSWDQTVKLWDAATGRERATFSWSIGRVYCLTYAPDGLRLAAGSDLGNVVVWDME